MLLPQIKSRPLFGAEKKYFKAARLGLGVRALSALQGLHGWGGTVRPLLLCAYLYISGNEFARVFAS